MYGLACSSAAGQPSVRSHASLTQRSRPSASAAPSRSCESAKRRSAWVASLTPSGRGAPPGTRGCSQPAGGPATRIGHDRPMADSPGVGPDIFGEDYLHFYAPLLTDERTEREVELI